MASALDAVLKLKADEQQRQEFQSQQITAAVELFQRARQNAQQNQIQKLQLAQDQPVKDAQVANYLSEAQSRKGQEMISNLIKGSQLKQSGRETKDRSVYDAGDILVKSSLGLPASINQYLGDAGKMMPPTSLNPKESSANDTMLLQTQATETDWTGSPTPAALEAKRQIELKTITDKKAAEQASRTPEEIQTADLNLKDLKRKISTPTAEELKIEENKRIEENRINNENSFAEDMLATISEIEKGNKYFGAAGVIPALPGEYNKVNWRANFDKIVSQNILKAMQDLKSQSKTGATGFGQLSNKELGVLSNASTVLKTNMSEEDAARYLKQMKEPLEKIINSNKGTKNVGSASKYQEGQTATNPKTGEKLTYRNGKWQ